MAQETLRWKLFPFSLRWKLFRFSLKGHVEQWCTHNVYSSNDDWGKLQNDFCLLFYLLSHLDSPWRHILTFVQLETKSIGVAWARFSLLLASSPELSMPNDEALHIFYMNWDSICPKSRHRPWRVVSVPSSKRKRIPRLHLRMLFLPYRP
jgi:hypothetical protein